MSEEVEHPSESTRFQRFKLLLWKSYLWHRYYWWWTIIEIFVRCFIPFYLGVTVPNDIKLELNPVIHTGRNSRRALLNTSSSYKYLAYAPSVSFTDELMGNVVNTLTRELVNSTPIELVKMANEKDLEDYTLNRSIHFDQAPLGIVFPNLVSSSEVPNKLIYKLRHSKAINTKWLLPADSIVGGAEYETEYWSGGFSAIQMLVNEEFTKMKVNDSSWSVPESVFQQFPYPEYETSLIERQYLLNAVFSAVICIEIALSIPFIASIIHEKQSGAKELMKVYGVEETLIWLSWFVIEFVSVLVSVTLMTIVLKIPFKGHATELVRRVKFSVLWSFLMLFSISNIMQTLFLCSIFNGAVIAALVYIFTNFFSVILIYVTNSLNLRYTALITTVIPAANVLKGTRFMLDAENHGFIFDWTTVKVSRDDESDIKAFVHFIMFVLDIIVYALLAIYIGSHNRDEFDAGLHQLSIFRSFYRRIRKKPVAGKSLQKVDETGNQEESILQVSSSIKIDDDDFGEFPQISPELTIQIEDLYKEYESIQALNGINMEFYDHEIGVVLGHEGSGKTILLSVLAGIMSFNRGSVQYKGVSVNEDANVLKKHMGICFQENRLFKYVTVLNHLIFYGVLKGLSKSSATDEAEHYLMKMEMQGQERAKINSLSDSTKRKLSIAISFMGDRQVLLLDEPMIGLDSQAKTATWNFLMGLRTDHTIVITSNYEKEAERLADRITILENGTIVAHGTPNSLRKNIGIHYEISVAGKETNFTAVTEAVQEHVTASIEHETDLEIIYSVPLTESSKFANLFEHLERSELGISEMNLTSSTIEHVLMKLGNLSEDNSRKSPYAREILESAPVHDSSYVPTRGISNKFRQMKILFGKRLRYVKKDFKSVFYRIVLPSLVLLIFTLIIEHLNFDPYVPMTMSPSSYIDTSIMIHASNSSEQVNKVFEKYLNSEHTTIVHSESSKLGESLIDFGRKDIMRFRRELIAAFELEGNKIPCIFYNLWTLHSLPIAITTYFNVILRNISNDESLEIITYNHPLVQAKVGCETKELWIQVLIVMILLFITFGYFTVEIVLYLFELSNKEIANNLMHLQIMSGVPKWIYWFTTIVFDLLFFIVVIVIRIMLFALLDNRSTFFRNDFSFGVFLTVVLIFGITALFYAYIISFLCKPESKTYTHLFHFNFICNLIIAMLYSLTPYTKNENYAKYSLLSYIFVWFPFLNFPWTLTQYLTQWYSHNECMLTCSFQLKSWCKTVHTASQSPLEFSSYENPYAILLELTFLIINLVISGVVFILMNLGFIDWIHNFFKSKEPPYRNYDEHVKHERREIDHVKEDSRHHQVPLLVDGLSKNYIRHLKPITAVEDVSFMAEHGTCFGILRGYDAGKTTVFNMMTAKTIPTKGDVSVEGVEMRANTSEYFSLIGYCPQTSPVIDIFTGEEMLTLITSLSRSSSDTENLVNEWISASGLDEVQNMKCMYYTNGNKRLLSTILALVGNPRVVFLDEPTSDVDSSTRRHLYDIIEQLKNSGRTVVLGSPSAIECYVLCDRLTILKKGVMHCLGHPHDLRKHYDLGFFLVIKVQSDVMSMREVRYLEEYMVYTFGSRTSHLLEQFRGLLHYQIADPSLKLSVLFKKMERIKENNPIIEDYTVRTTTLEDIFEFFSH